MRSFFLFCIAFVNIIQAIPFAPGENNLNDDKKHSNLINNANEVKPDLCLSEVLNDEDFDNNEGLFRRENHQTACPTEFSVRPHSIIPPSGGLDPNRLGPNRLENPCEVYGYGIDQVASCAGPMWSIWKGSYSSVFNCIHGKPNMFLQCD